MKIFCKPSALGLTRCVQTLSLGLFLWLLYKAARPLTDTLLPVDAFLRLDPVVATLVPLAAREWIPALVPGLVLLALTMLLGRFFCGWICPFGATLDLVRGLWLRARKLRTATMSNAANGGSTAKPVSAATSLREAQQIRQTQKLQQAKLAESTGSMGPAPSSGPKGVPGPMRSATASMALAPRLRRIKYYLLAVMFGAALCGVSTIFWGAPIPLITRFYGLLLHPLLLLAADLGLELARPVFAALDMTSLSYAEIALRRFDGLYFLLFFFGAIFTLEICWPRFWCRCLCPAGALLGLFARVPLVRRRVHNCISCGRCIRACPTKSVEPSAIVCLHSECIVCRKCVDVCPTRGTVFSWGRGGQFFAVASPATSTPLPAQSPACASVPSSSALSSTLPSRRAFMGASCAGVLLAGVQYSGLDNLLGTGQRGTLWPDACIRPPGAVPEPRFLDLCLRCGACMKACPSNGLQPTSALFGPSGLAGIYSPVLVSRRGPCEPDCNVCGQVCPSGALPPLPLAEKQKAKIGTAVIMPGRCLAWAENKSCVVCQEVCPYGAVDLVRREGPVALAASSQPAASPASVTASVTAFVPVPVINAARCYGCGYCEHHCPVRVTAVLVEPLNALRLDGTSYVEAAIAAGLELTPGVASRARPASASEAVPEGALPPGFSQ